MCGLGVIARTRPAPLDDALRARADAAERSLLRRGPDDGRTEHDGPVTLIHRRLSIQDLSHSAAQPMHLTKTDGTRLSLVYNGEVYNAGALRDRLAAHGRVFKTHADTEVVLHAIDAWGFDRAIDALRGMFALVCIRRDPQIDRFSLDAAVDHAGMKPLAFAFDRDAASGPTLTLASDADALQALRGRSFEPDHANLARVLSIGYCPAPSTVHQGVRKLGPGRRLHWTGGDTNGPKVTTWWHPPEHIESTRRLTSDDWSKLIADVAREHLIGDVPAALYLSAGLDSAAVAVALHRAGADMSGITAITLSTGDEGDESEDAALVAKSLGMPHVVVPFPHAELEDQIHAAAQAFDEPQGYTALLTMHAIARATRAAAPHAKVILSGDGGDEAFGGYTWHRHDPEQPDHPLSLHHTLAPDTAEHARLAALVATPDARGRDRIAANLTLSHLSPTHRHLKRLFDGFHPAESCALLNLNADNFTADHFADWLAHEDRATLPQPRRAQRLDLLGFCAGSIQPKLDRACMSVGLELRSPFLDRRILEPALASPVDPRETHTGKLPLRAMLDQGIRDGLLPASLLTRPKRGFSLRRAETDRSLTVERLTQLVDNSSLIASGTLRRDYRRYIPSHPETFEARMWALAGIAAWHDARCARAQAQTPVHSPPLAATLAANR